MEITDVRLRRVETDGRMKAISSITIDGEFVIHDIRVIDGNEGLFVAMPSKRTPDGELEISLIQLTQAPVQKFKKPF